MRSTPRFWWVRKMSAATLNVKLVLATTERQQTHLDSAPCFGNAPVAGALLVGRANRAYRSEFLRHVPNIVIVDDRDEEKAHDCVLSDGIGGAYEDADIFWRWGIVRLVS